MRRFTCSCAEAVLSLIHISRKVGVASHGKQMRFAVVVVPSSFHPHYATRHSQRIVRAGLCNAAMSTVTANSCTGRKKDCPLTLTTTVVPKQVCRIP